MIILLIRHGESEADILNVHEGRADFSLTEKGLKQVDAMSDYVYENYKVNKIYSSTLKRASQTASRLAKAFNLEINYDENLMEFNNGLLAGLSREEANLKYPEVPNLPIDQAVYGQESKIQFRNRAKEFLNMLVNKSNADDIIAVVTHGGMINQLYYELLDLPVVNKCFFGTGDTGIHVIKYASDKILFLKSNYCEHIKQL